MAFLFGLFKKRNQVDGTYHRDRSADNGQNDYGYAEGLYDTVSEGFRMTIEDVFTITGRGTVVTGKVETGSVSVGDTVILRRVSGGTKEVTITGVEMFRKILDKAVKGDNVGLLLRGVDRAEVGRGDILEKNC